MIAAFFSRDPRRSGKNETKVETNLRHQRESSCRRIPVQLLAASVPRLGENPNQKKVDTMCVLLLAVCTASLMSCTISPTVGQADERPEPGQWCRVRYHVEAIGPFKTRHRLLTGQVKSVAPDSIQLVDVAEDQYVISGPVSWRKLPYLSRLTTTSDKELRLVEERTFSSDQVKGIEILSDRDAELNRRTIVWRGGTWVRITIGIDARPND